MRVTMTPPMLAHADCVLFLVTGEDKADAARRAFEEPPSDATPASRIRSRTGRRSQSSTGRRLLDCPRYSAADRPAV